LICLRGVSAFPARVRSAKPSVSLGRKTEVRFARLTNPGEPFQRLCAGNTRDKRIKHALRRNFWCVTATSI
jgi:hypothetical protein